MLKAILGWVSAARTSTSDRQDESSSRIARHELPGGRVVVTVHDHAFDALEGFVPCWTYVSHGLKQVGHKEVVLSVQRSAGESLDAYPRDLLAIFGWLYGRAREGRVTEVGSVVDVELGHVASLGEPTRRGLAFTPGEDLAAIALPRPSMTAVLLTGNELDAVRQFGLVRFMGQLGSRYRYFPTAAWCVRGRPDVTSPTDMSSSVLTRSTYVRMLHTHAYLRGIETRREVQSPTGSLDNNRVTYVRQEMVLELSTSAAAELGRFLGQFPHDTALSLIMSPDPDADASMVWTPGQKGMNAITQGGTGLRIAGNHIVFVPGQPTDQVRVLEDGFALLLTNTTWQEIRQLFGETPQNWGMPVTGDMGFRVKMTAA
jgi:hypothetical protein